MPHRSFEALFVRALRAEGAFARELAAAGYDPDLPQPSYPLDCWRRTLEVARRHAFPELEPGDAYRQLGRLYVHGFATTPVGRVFAAAARLLGAERALARIPTYIRAGREDLELSLVAEGVGCWRLVVRDPDPLPEFVCGALEAVLALTGVRPTAEQAEATPGGYVVRVRWDAR